MHTDDANSPSAGNLYDTYVAALQHELADLPTGTYVVGVVRRPTRWFYATVDENYRSLGPPSTLLDEFAQERDDLKMAGLCDEGAHNAAWENLDFERRYREYLETDEPQSALASVARRLREGETVALVCYENTEQKRCHRTVLRDVLTERM
jgi:uncharacterized protein YeaO (DUF488 family)